MKDKILDEIGCMPITKEKNEICAKKVQLFIEKLTPDLVKDFWEIENAITDHDICIQDEIFKRLL